MIKLRAIRDRVRMKMRDWDAKRPVNDTFDLDTAICEAYLALGAQLPTPMVYTASGLTIAAGGDTFTLPTTVTQWTGNDGGAEYRGDVRLRTRSNGDMMGRVTVEELDAFREGVPPDDVHLGRPRWFTLWEDKTQTMQGRCYPGALEAEVCDTFLAIEPSDMRDFVGTGSDDLDDVEAELTRTGVLALIGYTCAGLLERMTDEDAARLRLDKRVAPMWRKEADDALYNDTVRRYQANAAGRIQRWVG